MGLSIGTSGITTRSGFIQEHPQLNRFPRNEREWTQFIRELGRWRQEYEGEFSVSATSGFSGASPSFSDFQYFRYGKIVIIEFPVEENDSNAANFVTAPIPKRIRPARQQIVPCIGLIDNGNPVTTTGQCRITAAGNMHFGLDGAGAGFTTSGKKGFGDSAGNCIIYSLFDAARID